MSTWNERIYYFTEKQQDKLLALSSKSNFWNNLVDEIEEDENVTCVHSDEIRFMRSCTDDEYANSKKRALKIINNFYKNYLQSL